MTAAQSPTPFRVVHAESKPTPNAGPAARTLRLYRPPTPGKIVVPRFRLDGSVWRIEEWGSLEDAVLGPLDIPTHVRPDGSAVVSRWLSFDATPGEFDVG